MFHAGNTLGRGWSSSTRARGAWTALGDTVRGRSGGYEIAEGPSPGQQSAATSASVPSAQEKQAFGDGHQDDQEYIPLRTGSSALEEIDGNLSAAIHGMSRRGGGVSCLTEEALFERGGVTLPRHRIVDSARPPCRDSIRRPLLPALGVSLVSQPRQSLRTTVHITCAFVAEKGRTIRYGVRGGMDLTPYYGFERPVHFHRTCQPRSDPFGSEGIKNQSVVRTYSSQATPGPRGSGHFFAICANRFRFRFALTRESATMVSTLVPIANPQGMPYGDREATSSLSARRTASQHGLRTWHAVRTAIRDVPKPPDVPEAGGEVALRLATRPAPPRRRCTRSSWSRATGLRLHLEHALVVQIAQPALRIVLGLQAPVGRFTVDFPELFARIAAFRIE